MRELADENLKKIAHELTENLRQNLRVDWSERESVRAKLRLMVKRILRKYKYPFKSGKFKEIRQASSSHVKITFINDRCDTTPLQRWSDDEQRPSG